MHVVSLSTVESKAIGRASVIHPFESFWHKKQENVKFDVESSMDSLAPPSHETHHLPRDEAFRLSACGRGYRSFVVHGRWLWVADLLAAAAPQPVASRIGPATGRQLICNCFATILRPYHAMGSSYIVGRH